MSGLFLKLLNMSLTAGWLILAVIVFRFLFKKTPKWMFCALWGIVALRLICPISMESVMSLVPDSEPIYTSLSALSPYIQTGVNFVDNVANAYLTEYYDAEITDTVKEPVTNLLDILALVWFVGILLMSAHGIVSYIRLKRSVGASVRLRDNIMECDDICYPFILGIIRPVIYLPSSLEEVAREYVVIHELAHIKRHDHWWKPIGFLILTIHWFNPLCWISYILLCRDIELATDEKVIKDMEKEEKVGYSQTLLNIGRTRRMITVCPLAFGEVGVKERIKGILHYKKPSFWIVLISAIVCIVVFICFFTSPKEAEGSFASVDMEEVVSEPAESIEEPVPTDDFHDEIRVMSNRQEVMKEYICEQIGFGGMFTLTLYENGTFSYYEGAASSYFGNGGWLFEDEKLTLFDKGTGKFRKVVFDYEKGDLIYNQQESDQYPFTYVELEDGKRFVLEERADEEFYLDLERQLTEQTEEIRRRIMEAGKNNPEDNISLKQFVGQNVEGTLYIDARETVMDEQIPIKINIVSRAGKTLWEGILGIPHMAWNSFYLYREDGIDYLIEYNPEESQGQIAYTFRMFTVNEQGEQVMKCEYSARTEEERDTFHQNVSPYLQKATFLVSTIGGEIRYK